MYGQERLQERERFSTIFRVSLDADTDRIIVGSNNLLIINHSTRSVNTSANHLFLLIPGTFSRAWRSLSHIPTLQQNKSKGVPVVAQQVKNLTQCPQRCRFDPWPRSVGYGSNVATSYSIGHRCGSDLALPWLWHRPEVAVPIQLLVWKLYMPQVSPSKEKKKKKENIQARLLPQTIKSSPAHPPTHLTGPL